MNESLDFVIDPLAFFEFGRLLSSSKSSYTLNYPNHFVVFNANLCTRKHGKFWYGDLDLITDAQKLQAISAKIGEDVLVLREMDARFANERSPLFERAVAIITATEIKDLRT